MVGTPCPDQLSAQLDSPRPGRVKEIRQQGRAKMLTIAHFLSILLRQHLRLSSKLDGPLRSHQMVSSQHWGFSVTVSQSDCSAAPTPVAYLE